MQLGFCSIAARAPKSVQLNGIFISLRRWLPLLEFIFVIFFIDDDRFVDLSAFKLFRIDFIFYMWSNRANFREMNEWRCSMHAYVYLFCARQMDDDSKYFNVQNEKNIRQCCQNVQNQISGFHSIC